MARHGKAWHGLRAYRQFLRRGSCTPAAHPPATMPSTCVRDASPFAHDIHLARGLAGPSVGAHVGAVRCARLPHHAATSVPG